MPVPGCYMPVAFPGSGKHEAGYWEIPSYLGLQIPSKEQVHHDPEVILPVCGALMQVMRSSQLHCAVCSLCCESLDCSDACTFGNNRVFPPSLKFKPLWDSLLPLWMLCQSP